MKITRNRKSVIGRDRINRDRRKYDRLRLTPVILTIAVVISACGGSKSTYSETAAAMMEEIGYDTGATYDMAEAAAEEPVSEESYVSEGGGQEVAVAPQTSRKLIKTVNISAETEAFDALVPGLQKQVETLGGYIESISVYDVGSYYVEDREVKQRCANLTARVPKEKLDGFLAQVGEQTNVTSRSENVEDVTLQYVDLESHKKALLTEQGRLLELMEQAENVEDIIAIEGRLSEVRYQLESMESQLRTYDNQIDYSTVYLNIQEVRKYSAPQTATVWERIESGFMKSLSDIGFGIRDLAIGFVIDIPYIVLWIFIIAVAVFLWRILRKAWKKRREKKGGSHCESAVAGMCRRLFRERTVKEEREMAVKEADADRAETNTEQAGQKTKPDTSELD